MDLQATQTLSAKRFHRTLVGVYAALFVYLFILQFYAAWDYTIDDAFISLRYAKHLANGLGLVWNSGEPPLEGYSNFSFVLLAALFFKLHLPALFLLKACSLAAIALTLRGLYLLAKIWLPKSLAPLPALILLFHPGEILWGVSGLETSVYQCLIVYACYFLLQGLSPARQKKQTALVISGLLLSLASLTRPEAPMLFIVFVIGLSFGQFKSALKPFCLSFLLSFSPYFLWRWQYFGKLFANTVYCKALNAPSSPWELDIIYLSLIVPLTVFILPYLVKARDKRHYFLIVPSLAYLVALYKADWIVGYFDRHFLAAYALLLPLVVGGVKQCFEQARFGFKGRQLILLTVVFSLLSGYLFSSYQYTLKGYRRTAQSAKEGNRLRKDVALWLSLHLSLQDTVSVGDCGVIPYYYSGKVIDSYCLNNQAITQAPINYSYPKFTHWLLHNQKPKYIILLSLLNANKAFYPPSDLLLLNNPRFHRDYKKIKRFSLGDNTLGYQYVIYRRQVKS